MSAKALTTPAGLIVSRIPRYLSTIRIWESLYALPFCLMGMVLAAEGWPGWSVFIWITIALTGVRTLGMAANRLLHRKEDIHNPRTANRHLPTGKLKPFEVFSLMVRPCCFFLCRCSIEHTGIGISSCSSWLRCHVFIRKILHLGVPFLFGLGISHITFRCLDSSNWTTRSGSSTPIDRSSIMGRWV